MILLFIILFVGLFLNLNRIFEIKKEKQIAKDKELENYIKFKKTLKMSKYIPDEIVNKHENFNYESLSKEQSRKERERKNFNNSSDFVYTSSHKTSTYDYYDDFSYLSGYDCHSYVDDYCHVDASCHSDSGCSIDCHCD